MSRVYVIGEGDEVAARLYPGAEIARLEDAFPKEPMQAVVVFSVLQRGTYAAAMGMLQGIADRLEEGGEAHVFVPSLDWAARQMMKAQPSPATEFVIYGPQYQGEVYQSGWTIIALRSYMHRCGFIVTAASRVEDEWVLKAPNGDTQVEPVELNYVKGVRHGTDSGRPVSGDSP